MRTIWRYELEITGSPVVRMSEGATVLPSPPSPRGSGHIEVWAEVDPAAPLVDREFRVVGTGNPAADDRGRFVGTVVTHGGMFVWHVYEAA